MIRRRHPLKRTSLKRKKKTTTQTATRTRTAPKPGPAKKPKRPSICAAGETSQRRDRRVNEEGALTMGRTLAGKVHLSGLFTSRHFQEKSTLEDFLWAVIFSGTIYFSF